MSWLNLLGCGNCVQQISLYLFIRCTSLIPDKKLEKHTLATNKQYIVIKN